MDIAEILFVRTWWQFEPPYSVFDQIYHWFNISEGIVWLVFSVLVWRRACRHSETPAPRGLEVAYAIAFATFGLTDLQEAWRQSSWLIWLKLLNLVALAVLRHRVIHRHYPTARLY